MKYGYIYKVYLPDGRYYIGQKKALEALEYYYGSGIIIQNYIKKHGTSSLKREILDWAEDKEELNHLESFYIGNLFETDPLCINLKGGGNQHLEYSIESKNKMRDSQIAYRKSLSQEERNLKYGKQNLGKQTWLSTHKLTDEEKEKRLKSLSETLATMSSEERKLKFGHMKGKKHSLETRLKMKNSSPHTPSYNKEMKCFNNGLIQGCFFEQPEGWWPGMLDKKRKEID